MRSSFRRLKSRGRRHFLLADAHRHPEIIGHDQRSDQEQGAAGALAYLLLGERLTLLQILGGVAIISAVLLLRPPVSPGSDVFEPNSECTQNPNRS